MHECFEYFTPGSIQRAGFVRGVYHLSDTKVEGGGVRQECNYSSNRNRNPTPLRHDQPLVSINLSVSNTVYYFNHSVEWLVSSAGVWTLPRYHVLNSDHNNGNVYFKYWSTTKLVPDMVGWQTQCYYYISNTMMKKKNKKNRNMEYLIHEKQERASSIVRPRRTAPSIVIVRLLYIWSADQPVPDSVVVIFGRVFFHLQAHRGSYSGGYQIPGVSYCYLVWHIRS